jgi:hypothetical protein
MERQRDLSNSLQQSINIRNQMHQLDHDLTKKYEEDLLQRDNLEKQNYLKGMQDKKNYHQKVLSNQYDQLIRQKREGEMRERDEYRAN